jgi:phage gp16-like protein
MNTQEYNESVKVFAETISKTKLTPKESERVIKVMRLKGWKRLFPKRFGL